MESLGSLAAIAQLIEQTIKMTAKLSDTYNKVRGQVEELRQQTSELIRLQSDIETLDQNKVLKTASTQQALEAIIAKVQKLKELLKVAIAEQKGGIVVRYYRTWIRFTSTQQIHDTFIAIQQDKINLLLSITTNNTELSSNIQRALQEALLLIKGESALIESLAVANVVISDAEMASNPPITGYQTSRSSSRTDPSSAMVMQNKRELSTGTPSTGTSDTANHQHGQSKSRHQNFPNNGSTRVAFNGNTYEGTISSENGRVIQGNTGECRSEFGTKNSR
ncbi:hypothetical protein MMC14_002266 [Varicellaria rhodocarpa]|nr:hypothetical protein [Varicellaria rhodocarpa]